MISAGDKLTNMQLELLKVFRYNLTDDQLVEIKNLLSSYFAQKVDIELEKFWDEKNLDNETMKSWANSHTRTGYNR